MEFFKKFEVNLDFSRTDPDANYLPCSECNGGITRHLNPKLFGNTGDNYGYCEYCAIKRINNIDGKEYLVLSLDQLQWHIRRQIRALGASMIPDPYKAIYDTEEKCWKNTHIWRFWRNRYDTIEAAVGVTGTLFSEAHGFFPGKQINLEHKDTIMGKLLRQRYAFDDDPYRSPGMQSFFWFTEELQNYLKQYMRQQFDVFMVHFSRWKEEHISLSQLKKRYEKTIAFNEKRLGEIENQMVYEENPLGIVPTQKCDGQRRVVTDSLTEFFGAEIDQQEPIIFDTVSSPSKKREREQEKDIPCRVIDLDAKKPYKACK